MERRIFVVHYAKGVGFFQSRVAQEREVGNDATFVDRECLEKGIQDERVWSIQVEGADIVALRRPVDALVGLGIKLLCSCNQPSMTRYERDSQ